MVRIRTYVMAGVLAVIVVAAGSAYAATAGSGGKITVCVKRSDGDLYRSKTCHTGDSKLSWNVRGPAGANGATGATGARGATGTAGTNGANGTNGTNGANGTNGTNGAVAVYTTQEVRGAGEELIGASAPIILTENLPAGDYVVNAKLNYEFASDSSSTSNGFATGTCTLNDGFADDPSQASQYVEGTSGGEGTAEGESPMSMQLVLDETVGTTVQLTCAPPSGATTVALIYDADLEATEVNQISGTPSGF